MGNKQLHENKVNEMSMMSSQGNQRFLVTVDEEEFLEPVFCCCFRVGKRKY